MAEKDLKALEDDARRIADPAKRAEHMRLIGKMRRSMEMPKETGRSTRPSFGFGPPLFQGYRIGTWVRLLLGVVAFLALCFSLILIMTSVAILLEGHWTLRSGVLLGSALFVAAISVASLYVLSRERMEPVPNDQQRLIIKEFARRKLKFQLSVLGMMGLVAANFVFDWPLSSSIPFSGYWVTALFFIGYLLLGKVFWRCPSCSAQLSFTNKYADRQSIRTCPYCHARLQ